MNPKIIAIIDDDPDMKDAYEIFLGSLVDQDQIRVHFFQQSADFLVWLQSSRADLLLCDINMPLVSGPELCRKLRSSGHDLPIYFVSGHNPAGYQEIVDSLSINRFITKPIEREEMLAYIGQDLQLDSGTIVCSYI